MFLEERRGSISPLCGRDKNHGAKQMGKQEGERQEEDTAAKRVEKLLVGA